MRKLIVSIQRKDTLTLEIILPDNVTKAEATETVMTDPADYLEKHLGNIQKENVDFSVTALTFKD